MSRLACLVCSGFALSATFAADWHDISDGVLTFNVGEGVTEKYTDAIPGTIAKIVKNGAGTVLVPGANTGFTAGKTVEIAEGVLEVGHKNALGRGNVVKVASGAQYKMNFAGTYGGHEGAENRLEFAGEGPDGAGAIYLGVGAAATRCDGFLGDFKLTADAKIGQYASQWRGTSGVCDLGGHKLTVVGNNYFNIGNAGTVWKGGRIDLRVGTVLLGNPTFEGGEENGIDFSGSLWQFWSLTTPIPWTVTFKTATSLEIGQCLVNGSYSTNCNIIAGPFRFEESFTIRGYSSYTNPGRCMTFSGPVSGGAGKMITLGSYNPQVYFAHANTFHGLSIAASANANAYALADGALPSVANATHYLSLHGSSADSGAADIWLGNGLCTSQWAASVIASMDSWNPFATSAKLGLHTSGDYTFAADIPEPNTEPEKDRINNVCVSHTGTGTLTFTGAFPSASARKVRVAQRENNTTVFGAPDGETVVRQLAGLHVLSGTVEVARGSRLYAPDSSAGNVRVGGYEEGVINDTGVPAKLVVRAGGSVVADNPSTNVRVGSRGATPAVLDIEDGASVTNNLRGGDQAADRTAIRQFGGDVYNLAQAGYDGYLACRGRGFYGLFGGTFRSGSFLTVGGIPLDDAGTARGSGLFLQTGGSAKFQGPVADSAMVSRGGDGEYLMKGGTLNASGTFYVAGQQYNKTDVPNASAVFSLHGDGNPTATFDGTFYLTRRQSGVCAMLNLNAGSFSAEQFESYWCVGGRSDSTSVLNFNGGTYRLRAKDRASILRTDWRPYKVVVYGQGATFDVPDGKNYWLSSLEGNADSQLVFASATGKGLKSVRVPADMPREGYSGIVPCKVIGGGKDCRASVALDFDPATGTIAEDLLITCPGCDYLETPRVIAYGPDFTTEYECSVELTDGDQALSPGKVYKTGPGQFAINVVTNTFAGTYVISNGTLKIPANNRIATNASVFVAGGHFWYDWRDRTIKSLGGYGGFFGYKGDNSTHRLTVDGSLDFDAADLQAGRFLEMESDVGENQPIDRDNLFLGAGCVVRIAHPELLPEGPASYTLLKVNVPLNRTPELADAGAIGDGRWKVKSVNGGKTLKLFHSTGFFIYMR